MQSRRERMVSDRDGQPVRRLTSALNTYWLYDVMDTEDARQAPLVKGIYLPWLTLPFSLSWSLLHTKRQAGHIRSKGEAWWTLIYWSVSTGNVVIQLCHAVLHDCYLLDQLCFTTATMVNQTTEVGKWLNEVYGIASYPNLLKNWRVAVVWIFSCPNWFPGRKDRLLLCISPAIR